MNCICRDRDQFLDARNQTQKIDQMSNQTVKTSVFCDGRASIFWLLRDGKTTEGTHFGIWVPPGTSMQTEYLNIATGLAFGHLSTDKDVVVVGHK